MTYEQIIEQAKVEIANVGGQLQVDLGDPRMLIEAELRDAFAVYDNSETGEEFVRQLEIADVRG